MANLKKQNHFECLMRFARKEITKTSHAIIMWTLRTIMTANKIVRPHQEAVQEIQIQVFFAKEDALFSCFMPSAVSFSVPW